MPVLCALETPGPHMPSPRAAERPNVDSAQKILQIAEREFDRWLRCEERSAVALRVLGTAAQQRERALARVRIVMTHERPAAASCQWISEVISAWAPLELLFPACDHAGAPGVSGELPLHASALVEREYGHVLAATPNFESACERLHADAQQLDLEISIGRALCGVLDETGAADTFWVEELRGMHLAMAEYLHRLAIGLPQILSDKLVMNYTARIGRMQRTLRERYSPTPIHIVRALAAANA